MIKSVQKDYDRIPTIEYPCILRSKTTGQVVAFEQLGKGMALSKGYHKTGSIAEDWIMDSFVPYNGIIELSNA